MQVKFNVFWKKNLGTLYKDNSIDTVGKEASVDIDLKQVHNMYVNFKVGDKAFTDLVEIVDIETGLINIPFKTDVIKLGTNELELVANMKNGDVLPSQTYTYKVDKSLENPNSVEAETNYPILIELLKEVDNSIKKLDTHWEEKEVEIDNRVNEALSALPDSNGQSEAIRDIKNKVDNHEERLNILENTPSVPKDLEIKLESLENKSSEYEARISKNEKTIKNQGVLIDALFDLTETISITEEGNVISLPQSKDGTVMIEGLEGNTLVNYCTNGSEELTLNNEINEQGYNAIIKPSTQYTVAFNTDKSGEVNIDLGGAKTSTTNNVATITTPSELTDDTLRLYGEGIKVSNVRLLEGDKTNYIPNYFEGMKSCFEDKLQDDGTYKMEILSNNENLLTVNTQPYYWRGSNKETVKYSNGNIIINGTVDKGWDAVSLATTKLLKRNTLYTITCKRNQDLNVKHGLVLRYWYEGEIVSDFNYMWNSGDMSKWKYQFSTPNFSFDTVEIGFVVTWDKETVTQTYNNLVFSKIGIAENYTLPKSNKIQFSSIEPLRGIGDVKDGLVLKDGKLMIERNCGKGVLGGEISLYHCWDNNPANVVSGYIYYNEHRPPLNNVKTHSNVKNNLLPSNQGGHISKVEGFRNTTYLAFSIHKSKLGISDVNAGTPNEPIIRQYFNDNPLEFIYQLAEPTYEEVPYETQKLILECFENGTLFIDTLIPPTVSVTYSANKPVVAKLNQVDNTTNINTEDIAITQMAVDFLLMSSLGEEMINFKIKGGTNMSAYFASRIIKGALKYEDVINKYPNYKEDIDLILISEGYSDLIVEL